MRWSDTRSEKSANLLCKKGQLGDGGKTFNDKIPFKGFKKGVKKRFFRNKSYMGVQGNILNFVKRSLFLA